VNRAVELTLADPPGETTRWTGRAMAAPAGISLRSIQRIWAAHGLEPHRVRRFKLSNDPAFAAKLRDVVGLCLDPPAHAVVLSVDEKSRIQALDRTQPGLPMNKGRAGTMTHDHVRHGTTTLFAAMNVLDGTIIGQRMARRRHREFIRFLDRVEAAAPAGKLAHAILDDPAARVGPSTPRPPPARGRTRSRPSSPRPPAAGRDAAPSTRWSTSRPLSTATSRSITTAPDPPSGPPTPTASSRRSGAGTKRLRQTTLMSLFQGMGHEGSSPDRLGSTSLAEGRAWQGAALETTVVQTLMRGLATAGPCSVSGLPRSRSGRR
jgi:hypothetical protein